MKHEGQILHSLQTLTTTQLGCSDAWEEMSVKTMATLSPSVILLSLARDENTISVFEATVKGDYCRGDRGTG